LLVIFLSVLLSIRALIFQSLEKVFNLLTGVYSTVPAPFCLRLICVGITAVNGALDEILLT